MVACSRSPIAQVRNTSLSEFMISTEYLLSKPQTPINKGMIATKPRYRCDASCGPEHLRLAALNWPGLLIHAYRFLKSHWIRDHFFGSKWGSPISNVGEFETFRCDNL